MAHYNLVLGNIFVSICSCNGLIEKNFNLITNKLVQNKQKSPSCHNCA